MEILQSSAVKALVFVMYDSSDHVTGKTGLSPTVVISKNGASFGSPSGSVSEIANGFYKVDANSTDSNTLGMLALSATASGADQCTMAYEVVAYNPDTVAVGALQPSTAGRTLTVDASGNAPATLAAGAIAADAIDAGSVKADAVTKIQAGLSTFAGGAVASVTGSVGSVAGSIGGNLEGSVAGNVLGAVAVALVTNSLADGAIIATTIGSDAVAKIQNGLATPTNITAGTITTVTTTTNLTNAPTTGDLTATMKTSIAGLTIARVTLTDTATTLTNKTGFSLANGSISTATFAAGATIPRVTLADTVTTYTGNTPQTGDVYAKFNTMVELNSGNYRFTTPSLALAPTGDGGFTDDDRTELFMIGSEIVKVPREGEANTYTNTDTAETATVAIT